MIKPLLAAALALLPAPLLAQGNAPATPPATTGADSARPQTTAQAPIPTVRAGWLSDRRDLRVGQLLTVIVDERARASEQTGNAARNRRSQSGSLAGDILPEKSVGIGYDHTSDQGGNINRAGNLDATLTVRVTAIEVGGVARIEGKKLVNVDGRKQEIALTGLVRAEDVLAGNRIASDRIADAEILYKGKKIGPKSGIFGKLIGMLWP